MQVELMTSFLFRYLVSFQLDSVYKFIGVDDLMLGSKALNPGKN